MLAKITQITLVLLLGPMTAILANKVETNAVFHIECPDDVTVDCDAELWDLSAYGWAYVHGYGNPTPAADPIVTHYLNSCGTGHITRTWTAYDYQNNPYSCTQYIYVGASGGFNHYNIHWPPNYTTADCSAYLGPDDLPSPYDYPTYDYVDCSQIMIGFDDLVFDFGGGCRKVLRTWTLLDWCSYNPNHPSGSGRWDYTQIIKVKPDGDIILTCADDIEAPAGANCSGTYVDVPTPTAIGSCGGTISVTHDSPYASNHGPDASGHYPFGTSWVTFTAEDACGNWKRCQVKIVVKDMKKPTPICYNGLTANLMMNSDGYYIDLNPTWFNKGSFDNCTPDHLLSFRIEPSRFDCDTRGRQDVRVFVTDLNGNTQYCNTYVIIQDNMSMCPPIDTSTYSASGSIVDMSGDPIEGLSIELMANLDVLAEQATAATGEYQFDNLLNSNDYMVVPRGNNNYTDGLSTLDLLKLSKHIHGIKELEEDGQLLAADADQNGQIDVLDLLTLRRLMLNQRVNLPNNKAWRFIPSLFMAENEENILDVNFDEYLTVQDLNSNEIDLNFTAIKIGDISGSAHDATADHARSGQLKFVLTTEEKDGLILVKSSGKMDLIGIQLALNFGASEIKEIKGILIDLEYSNVILTQSTSYISWYEILNSVSIEKGDVLFTIELMDDVESVDLKLNNRMLAPEMYSSLENNYQIELKESNLEKLEDFIEIDKLNKISIFPNPLKTSDYVQIISDNSAMLQLNIFDGTGSLSFQKTDLNHMEYSLSCGGFKPGLYLLQIDLHDGSRQTQKLVIQ